MKLISISRAIPGDPQHTVSIYIHPDLFQYDPHHQDVSAEQLALAYVQACPELQEDVIILRSVKTASGKYYLLVQGIGGTPRNRSKEVLCSLTSLPQHESIPITLDEVAGAGFPGWILKPDYVSYWIGAVGMPHPLKRPVSAELITPIQNGVQDAVRPSLEDTDNTFTFDPRLQQAHEDLMNAIDEVLKQYKQQHDDSGFSSLLQISGLVSLLKGYAPNLYDDVEDINQKIDAQFKLIDDAKLSPDGVFSKKRDRLIPIFIQQTSSIHEKDKLLQLYKLELIWLLYSAAQAEAKSISRMPDDNETMRSKSKARITAFNSAFTDIASLGEDKTLSPIELAYANLGDLSLEELLIKANLLLPKKRSLTERVVPQFLVQAASSMLSNVMTEPEEVRDIKKTAQKTMASLLDTATISGRSLHVDLDLKEGRFAWAEQVTNLVAERQNFIDQLIESAVGETKKATDTVQKILSTFKEIRQLVRAAHLKQMEMELATIRHFCSSIGKSKDRLRQLVSEYHILFNGDDGKRFSAKSVERIKRLNAKRGERLPNPDEFSQLLDEAQGANAPLPLDFPHANEPALLDAIISKAEQLRKERESLEKDEQHFRTEISWLETKLVEEKKRELNLRCDTNRTLYASLESVSAEVIAHSHLPQDLLGGYLRGWNQAMLQLHLETVNLSPASQEAKKQREHRFVKAKREAIRDAKTLDDLKRIRDELDQEQLLLTNTKRDLSAIADALSQIAGEQRAIENASVGTKVVAWFKHHRATLLGFISGIFAGGSAGAVAGALGGSALVPGLGTLAGAVVGFVVGGFCGALGGSGIGRMIDARRDKRQTERRLQQVMPVSVPPGIPDSAIMRGSVAIIHQGLVAASTPEMSERPQSEDRLPTVNEPAQQESAPAPRLSWGAWVWSIFGYGSDSTKSAQSSDQAVAHQPRAVGSPT